jgi:UDP-hydrolysing UDP-N-acetyl-D-glucosamine 2-epimerase
MTSRRKVAVVITNRASYARIRSVLSAIRDSSSLELQLILAGSLLLEKYGNAASIIEADGFRTAARVHMVLEGENLPAMAKTTAIGMLELTTLFENLGPDIVLTVADRYETIATAVTGAYLNIPVAHVQGGEVSGSIDERVRHAVTKLSDVHFVSNSQARERVLRMGEHPNSVFVTGCPSIDLACSVKDRPLSFDPLERYLGVGPVFDVSRGYLIVMQHPVTTEYEATRSQIQHTLDTVDALGVPTLWFWPNVDAGSDGISKGIRMYRERCRPKHIHFFKNTSPTDFLELLNHCSCIVGNSSAGIRESSFLGVPAVNIGTRQRGRERGPNVIDVPHDTTQIKDAITKQLSHGRYESVPLYGDGKAGERIAKNLSGLSYCREKIWHQV